MQLYAGSSRQFIDDTFQNRIAEKLKESFFRELRYQPSPSEVRSWQNSLRAMSQVLQYANLTDQGILLEYQLPLSSKRLDCMVTGKSSGGSHQAVIVELKQWEHVELSNIEDCVVTFVGGRKRDELHPSRQVGQYRDYLADNHTAFSDDSIGLSACAYMHNAQYSPEDPLFSPVYGDIATRFPVFTGDQSADLVSYLGARVGAGEGMDVLGTVLESKYRPSRKLLDHTAAVVRGQSQYVLLDDQLVVLNAVLEQARRGYHSKKKSVMLVHGGPGTGKSVIALHLLAELASMGLNVQHATGSKAFTENLRKLVGNRAGAQFKYFNSYPTAERDEIDVLVMDEAHRIRETSANRFTRAAQRSGKPQIAELLHAAKVSVFFIDDRQIVRPAEVGSSQLIRDAAAAEGAELHEFDLETQFRCGGSDGFINWVENTLAIRRTPNVLWDNTDGFEFRIMDSVQDLEMAIRSKQEAGQTARLTAGFCWPWSKPTASGELVPDVRVGAWAMPWNARSDAGRLAAGIPKETYWASDPRGIEQVGCVYTAQEFEFDYVGVIWGTDLVYDPIGGQWVGKPSESEDTVVKRSKDSFTDLVKNTYRVLLTRGMKGCYVYFQDDATRNFVRSRLES